MYEFERKLTDEQMEYKQLGICIYNYASVGNEEIHYFHF